MNDTGSMNELLAFNIGTNDMNSMGKWCDEVRNSNLKLLMNKSDNQMMCNNPYVLPTYSDFLLMAREDIECLDTVLKYHQPAHVRFAAFLMQQVVEKLLKALLTYDGNQQDTHDHDIRTLIDEYKHEYDINRIKIPSEISDNADEISLWYRRDVKHLLSDEVMSDVLSVLPSLMKS